MQKKLQYLIGILLLSLVGLPFVVMQQKSEEKGIQLSGISPYIKILEESLVDNLVLTIQAQTNQKLLQSIQNFTVEQHKFFNANQILKILKVLKDDQVRNNAILVIKPYISPLSTNQAQQILIAIPQADEQCSGIIMSQIYDLKNNIENKKKLNSTLLALYNQLYRFFISYQFQNNFITNFLITSEGLNIAFIIDQSSTMNTVAYTKEDGTKITRYQLLSNFFQDSSYDILQKFKTYSYKLMGNFKDESRDDCVLGNVYQSYYLHTLVENINHVGGDSNIYQSLEYFLSKQSSQISDIYILSDGISTEGSNYVNDFIKLVEETNSLRITKIRINTISFLVGGNEPLLVKYNANNLLQTLADITRGTFIQVQA